MLQRIAITLLLAASMSAAAEVHAQDTGSGRARSGRMRQRSARDVDLPSAMSDANVMAHLAASDSLEIRMSQMALPHLAVEDVRDFAQMLMRDHSASLQKAAAAAQSAGITPMAAPGDSAASRMMAMMNHMMGQHGGMPGMSSMNMSGNMDTMFVRHNVQMHARALRQLGMLRAQAHGPAVQQQLDASASLIREHLERAMRLAHKLKIPADTTGRMDMRGMHDMNGMPMKGSGTPDTMTTWTHTGATDARATGTPAAVVNQLPAPAAARTGVNPAINATNGGMNAGMGSSTSGMNNGTINGTNGANGAGTIGANAVNNGSVGGTTAGNPAARVPPIQPGRVTPPPKRPKASSDSSGRHPTV